MKRTEIGAEVGRNQIMKTVQSLLKTKSLCPGSQELGTCLDCFWYELSKRSSLGGRKQESKLGNEVKTASCSPISTQYLFCLLT